MRSFRCFHAQIRRTGFLHDGGVFRVRKRTGLAVAQPSHTVLVPAESLSRGLHLVAAVALVDDLGEWGRRRG